MKKLLLPLLISGLLATAARADISISYSFQVTYLFGSFSGMNGATMAFTIASSQATYGDFLGAPTLTPDSITLTVSGASDNSNDGVFSISNASNYRLTPDLESILLALNSQSLGPASFTFGPNNVNLASFNPNTLSLGAVSPGAPVSASDFNGASMDIANFSMNSSQYSVTPNTVISAGAVPEPGHYAALLAAGALGLVLWRRKRARA